MGPRLVDCWKPGKVRVMVEKSLAMAKLNEAMGLGKMRVITLSNRGSSQPGLTWVRQCLMMRVFANGGVIVGS